MANEYTQAISNLAAAAKSSSAAIAALPAGEAKAALELLHGALTKTIKTTKLLLIQSLGMKLRRAEKKEEPPIKTPPRKIVKYIPDPVVAAEIIDVEGDGSDFVIMLTIKIGSLEFEFHLNEVKSCTAQQWDQFLNHDAPHIGSGPELRNAWMTSYFDDTRNETMYEIWGAAGVPGKRETGLALQIPGRVLLPALRSAVPTLFELAAPKVVTISLSSANVD
jgi:hypothetical protein